MTRQIYQEPLYVKIIARVPPGLHKALKLRAKRKGLTASELLRRILIREFHLKEDKL